MEALIEDFRKLERRQKIDVLEELNREMFGVWPGLARDEKVCGGSIRIRGTRIPVWVIAGFRIRGLSDEALLDAYPTLTQEDLKVAFAYAERYPEEIERELRENEELEDD
jgi:uncharacterized protein (DUF433 family)